MPGPEHISRPQHDQFKAVGTRVSFQYQLLGDLVVAVAAFAAARKIFRHWFVRLAAAVVNPERADVHETADAAEPHCFGDIARAAEIDVKSERQRFLYAAADQASRMDYRLDAMLLDGLKQCRQVAHVLAHERVALL